MQQALGQPFVVENRPGATGEVGARQVIRAAPDGHTLMHAPISTWAINVALRPNLGYDPVRELTRITLTVRTPNVLVVNPQAVPANDLPGVIDWLKRNAAHRVLLHLRRRLVRPPDGGNVQAADRHRHDPRPLFRRRRRR